MQNWQKDRNYRKYNNPDGSFTFIITVDGVNVEVSAEVYEAYSKHDRRERYCAERDAQRLLPLEYANINGETLSYLDFHRTESAEDAAIRNLLASQSIEVIRGLKPDERRLIQALVIDELTEQEYADIIGISQVAVHKRKKRIFKKILEKMGY